MASKYLVTLLFAALLTLAACSLPSVEDYSASQQFAEETARLVISDWNKQVFLERFAEAALEGTTDEQIDALFEVYRQEFGKVVQIGSITGEVKKQARVGTKGIGAAMTGVYTIPVEFDLRSGKVVVTVQKFEEQWLVVDFRIRGKVAKREAEPGVEETE